MNNNTNNIIGNRIKEAMKKNGLKQADIVKMTGINKGALSSYISGKYEPKTANICKLAIALNVDPVWLTGLDVPADVIYNYGAEKTINDEKKIDDLLTNIDYENIKIYINNNKNKILNILDYKTIMLMIAEKKIGINENIKEDEKFKETNEKIFKLLLKDNPNLKNYNYNSQNFIDYMYNKTMSLSIKKTAFLGCVQDLYSIEELATELINRNIWTFNDKKYKLNQQKIDAIVKISNTFYEKAIKSKESF